MATPNLTIMQKADMEVADLINNGGYLQSAQAKKFIKDLIKSADLMKVVRVEGIKSHTKLIDKVGINGRVLRPGTSGQALTLAERSTPTTDQVELITKLMKAQINLTDEVLEDNIEAGQFKQTVMELMAEKVAYDMDDLLANGDTTSSDTLLALFDGMIKSADTNVYDAGSVPLTKAILKAMLKTMPSQYNRLRQRQRFLVHEDSELDYRDSLSDRMGALGDDMVQNQTAVRYSGRGMLPIASFPDALGGANKSASLLCDPKNAYFGIWRKIRVETDRNIETGEWLMVTSVRAGFVWEEKDAVVKATNVSIA